VRRLQRLDVIDRKRKRASEADGAQRVQLSEYSLDRSTAELSGGNRQQGSISGEPASAPCTGVNERSLVRPVATDVRDVSMKRLTASPAVPTVPVHRNERSLDAPITAMRIVTVPEEVALVTSLPRIASRATSIAIGMPTIWSSQRPGAGPA